MRMLGIHQLRFDAVRRWGSVPKASPGLLRQIQEHGFLDLVMVQPLDDIGHYDVLTHPELVVAAGLLQVTELPVIVRDDLDDDEVEEIVRNTIQDTNDNPIVEAEFFAARRHDLGRGKPASKATVARLSGTNRTYVSRSIALLTLPKSVKEQIRQGELSAGHGHLLVPLGDANEQERLAKRAVKERMSVRALRDAISDRTAPMTPRAPSKSPDILRIEAAVSGLLGSPVTIDHDVGKLSVDYFGNLAVLQGLLERLGYRE